jgi:DNA repair protein RecN (Recombination protein N)
VLLELRIENLLLIERAELRLGPGLNAITGETGAGKTVLAHSLDLLMGGRARPQIVRSGAEEAWVEGVFRLPDGVLEDPELAELAARLPEGADEIALGRRVGASGRTSAFIAGRSASAAELRALGSRLLSFYGQHQHRRLTMASAQLEVVDGFAGDAHLALRDRYRAAHREVARLAHELAELREREGTRERDLDLLSFELTEIESVAPDADEESELEAERARLRHAEGLRQAAGSALVALDGLAEDGGGARAAVGEAGAGLEAVHGVDPSLDELAERLASLAVEIDDAAGGLRAYLDGIEADPGRLEAVEERLEAVERLKRKHGGSVADVLAHGERCRAEIERLENSAGLLGALEERLGAAEAERARLGASLTSGRERAGAELAQRIAPELAELGMDGATLEVALPAHADGFGPTGAETVELLAATNPGMPTSPLREAASGGELSRIMLALMALSAPGRGGDEARRTLLFDELDAGIGGNTARAVGARLRRLAEAGQVVCITHLPQVASLAEVHFRIEKQTVGDRALARVERVDGDDLVAEIVRMLGGRRGDEVASRHAEELLRAA